MTAFRLLVLSACAIAVGTTARADDRFPLRSSDEGQARINRLRGAEDLPVFRLDAHSSPAVRSISNAGGNSAVTSADARGLASWARGRIQSGESSLFSADDVRAAEAWARQFDRRGSGIRRVQNAVPAVPPAPKPIYEQTDSNEVCAGGSCLTGACLTCCEAGVIGGVEGVFLVPFGEPHQSVTLTDLLTGESRNGESDPGLGAGVRVWLGLDWDGSGFRVRYTYIGEENVDSDPFVPQNTRFGFHEAFDLNLQTLDFELTKQFCLGSWFMDASFGARYGKLQRNATVLGYGTLGNGVDISGFAMGSNEFEGTGFTASLGGRKAIHCDCNWNFFWNFRGSYLWGDASVSALTEANAITGPPLGVGSAHSRNHAFANVDHEDVFIAEVQLGLEYERCLECIPATLFFRVAVEYQHWEIDGLAAQSTSFAFLQGGPPAFGARVDAESNASDGELDLIGFVLGLGLRY